MATTNDTRTASRVLYRAFSTADRFPHYDHSSFDDVHIEWIVWKRPTQRADYAALVQDYEDGDPYQQGLADDLFTPEEVTALCSYLMSEHGDVLDGVRVEPVELPVVTREPGGAFFMPTSGIPVGGCCDFYMLAEESTYDLPFDVYGYFDLWDHIERAVAEGA